MNQFLPVVPAGAFSLKKLTTSVLSYYLASLIRHRIHFLSSGAGASSDERFSSLQTISLAGTDLDLRDWETSWGSARDLSPYPKMCEFTSDYSLFMRKCKEKHVYNYFDDKSPLRIPLTIGHNDRRNRPFFFIQNLGKNNHIILSYSQPTLWNRNNCPFALINSILKLLKFSFKLFSYERLDLIISWVPC